MKNKRVAVIGTGASACQFIPIIQPQVMELCGFSTDTCLGDSALFWW